jgi:hypothetical protein
VFTILVRYFRRCTWLCCLTLHRETFPIAGKSSTSHPPKTLTYRIPGMVMACALSRQVHFVEKLGVSRVVAQIFE